MNMTLSQVLLEAIRNILKSGQSRLDASGNNPYLLAFEQCGGIDAVELLQVCFDRLLPLPSRTNCFAEFESGYPVVFFFVLPLRASAARQISKSHAPGPRHLGELHWRRERQ